MYYFHIESVGRGPPLGLCYTCIEVRFSKHQLQKNIGHLVESTNSGRDLARQESHQLVRGGGFGGGN
jgi:hypothetical protein